MTDAGVAVSVRLRKAGIRLPEAVNPVANYVAGVTTHGPLLFISGQGTRENGAFQYVGVIGADLSVTDGYAAARICAVNLLAQVQSACGLGAVARVVKLTGFIRASPDFTDLPKVLNGASDLMVEAFGESGRHSRSAIGAGMLPFGMAVEVEGIFELSGIGAGAAPA